MDVFRSHPDQNRASIQHSVSLYSRHGCVLARQPGRREILSTQPLAFPGYASVISLCVFVFHCIILLPRQWEDALHAHARAGRAFCAQKNLPGVQVDAESTTYRRDRYARFEDENPGIAASGTIQKHHDLLTPVCPDGRRYTGQHDDTSGACSTRRA